MLKPKKPTTAPVVILLYWSLALVLLATVASGLRVDAAFGLIDAVRSSAKSGIVILHLASCLLLIAACILFLQSLRLEPDPVREVHARRSWRRMNSLVSQSFFALVALQALCALQLAAGGGIGIARLHLATTVLMILAVPAYVVLQFMIGGADYGLRMLRPQFVPPSAVPIGSTGGAPRRRRDPHQSTRLFGLVLGIVFGATAATAFVENARVPGPEAGLRPSALLIQIASGLPLRPAR